MAFEGKGTLVNVDHHATNDSFGEVNVIDSEASAAGEMVFDLINAAGIKIDKGIATNLYVAIHTDTGSFRYSCSTPGAFKKAGSLVELGADPWEVSTHVYENLPLKRFTLLGLVLSTMEVMEYGGVKVASLMVTNDMIEETGADRGLSDGFVNYARSVEGCRGRDALKESEGSGETCKVSLRSKGKVDVSAVAARFNGGGHKNAAGCTIDGTLESAKEKLLAALKEAAFDHRGSIMNGVIVVDKPKGITSHDVVASVKRTLKASKVGHLGTLDPNATGCCLL